MTTLADLLHCPNCGGDRFYVEPEGRAMIFVHVLAGPLLVTGYGPGEVLPDSDELARLEIYCTDCGWHGAVSELKAHRRQRHPERHEES
ncbi:MAG: hypothetical protein AB7D57_06550 [Desulfovibrionaceae bacterium]